jgi:hypothetical protein
MFHKNHLRDAAKYSRAEGGFLFYFIHMFWAVKFAALLFVWAIAMLVHALVPQLVGFSVLAKLIEFIREMKEQHPDDPLLSKVKFDDTEDNT